MSAPRDWAIHQLVQFLSDVVPDDGPGTAPDVERTMLLRGLERSAEALDAELGVILGGEDVVAAVGFGRGAVPHAQLRAALGAADHTVELDGVGRCRILGVRFQDAPDVQVVLARVGDDEFSEDEIMLLRGLVRSLELSARIGRALQVERSLREASERQAAEALLDPLTSLPNRALFLDRLDVAVKRARRSGGTVAVLYMDMDGFKDVNDSLGHAAGDELLIAVSARVRDAVRAPDTVARLGGDELGILVESTGGDESISAVAERVARSLASPVHLQGRTMQPSASIGIATSIDGAVEPGDLLRNADLAMYEAKRRLPGSCAQFVPDMHSALVERLAIEEGLRAALERGELALEYQPVVELDTGAVCGLEALLRWDHPTRGRLAPGEFMVAAEDSGLIVPIGEWVVGTACRQLRDWRDGYEGASDLNVAVNVSARQLDDDRIVEVVERALLDTGLPARRLVLELTETALLSDRSADVLARLDRLRALGVTLALDDFGTGHSSLTHLMRVPASILKIDRSFVAQSDADGNATPITRSIVALAHDLGLDAVAEGIETEAHVQAVRSAGCRFGQGYHFARPMRPEAIEATVFARPLAGTSSGR
jgi:diguanylate cyclase (GGDEF)-like protein